MYINFQQNRVCRPVNTAHTNLFAKFIACCINLQIQIAIFKNLIISDMHHRITYMHVNFRQNPICRPFKKTMHTKLFAKMACCINLQLPIAIFIKLITSDMQVM